MIDIGSLLSVKTGFSLFLWADDVGDDWRAIYAPDPSDVLVCVACVKRGSAKHADVLLLSSCGFCAGWATERSVIDCTRLL